MTNPGTPHIERTWKVTFARRDDSCHSAIAPFEFSCVRALTRDHAIQTIERKLDCKVDVVDIHAAA